VKKNIKLILIVTVLFLGCQSKSLSFNQKIKRIALVIGNQGYGENSLENPINDANEVSETLKGIGFDVTLKHDLTLKEFYKTLDAFKREIEPENSMVFFYFAGHGNTLVKNSKQEYLMMTDKEAKVLVSIYKIYEFLDEIKSKYNIIVIDACREFQASYRPLNRKQNRAYIEASKHARGNARATISDMRGKNINEFVVHDDNFSGAFPASTIISYSSANIAKDWSQKDREHSPYSVALIEHLDDEEIPINELFRRVRNSLIKDTNRTQVSMERTSLEKNIWLVPKIADVAVAPPI
jgi:uncharacterized caspase-like protein